MCRQRSFRQHLMQPFSIVIAHTIRLESSSACALSAPSVVAARDWDGVYVCTAAVELELCLVCNHREASAIFFNDQLKNSEHEACSTHSGTGGTCERSCSHPSVKSELLKCGIKDSTFLYCYNSSLESENDLVLSLLSQNLGRRHGHRSSLRHVPVQALILRPEAADSPPQNASTKAPPPERRPGIPEEEFFYYINDDSTLPPGIYQVLGGIEAEKNAWPWMVSMSKAEVVRLGEHDYGVDYDGSNPQDFDVAKTVFYPDYKHPQAYHDIALLKLAFIVKLEISR
ncbi:hypothetical protein GWK47_014733 [Chionoecetes opilio]|uniref:Uncharacterized protein n=1 Tax=Chionoecetes opilio TaxID=41210 RepID=A0A8J5CKW5_CHIOP|nr:hypothetical protein GWK47_014733 [Chionoecetes opilio]